jgi:AraC-like DNA-binding protein
MRQFTRTRGQIAADAREASFGLYFSTGPSPFAMTQLGREVIAIANAPAFASSMESTTYSANGVNGYSGLRLPRRRLLERVANADDLTLRPLDPNSESLRHLRRYLDLLLGDGGIGDDPTLIGHVNKTLIDLVALSLGASRDSAELARMRGLRAARATEVLAIIRAKFTDPSFSPRDVARKLRLSPRYVNDLLQETGSSFAERVTELRLQKVHAMLSDHRHAGLMVSEIAYECGFNDVSYFNRCFRQRFGASPKQFRSDGNRPMNGA